MLALRFRPPSHSSSWVHKAHTAARRAKHLDKVAAVICCRRATSQATSQQAASVCICGCLCGQLPVQHTQGFKQTRHPRRVVGPRSSSWKSWCRSRTCCMSWKAQDSNARRFKMLKSSHACSCYAAYYPASRVPCYLPSPCQPSTGDRGCQVKSPASLQLHHIHHPQSLATS